MAEYAHTALTIINRGLRRLGTPALADFTGTDSVTTQVEEEIYPTCEDLLSEWDWHFARFWKDLSSSKNAAETALENTEYTYAYALPEDHLRVLDMVPKGETWMVEGGFLYCNVDADTGNKYPRIRYVRTILDDADAGLVARYPLDDDPAISTSVKDVGPNAYHGVVDAGVSLVDGKAGKALSFTGATTTDNATLLTSFQADTFQDAAFTVSFWFDSDLETTGDGAAYIISRDTSDYWAFTINQSQSFAAQEIKVWVSNAPTVVGALGTDGMHHMALVANSGACKVYMDGVLKVTTATGFSQWAAQVSERCVAISANVEGNTPTEDNNGMDGIIDEVRFYDRALTLSEITGLYANPVDTVTTGTPSIKAGISVPSSFAYALSLRMASVMCMQVTGSQQLLTDVRGEYVAIMQDAKGRNELEHNERLPIELWKPGVAPGTTKDAGESAYSWS